MNFYQVLSSDLFNKAIYTQKDIYVLLIIFLIKGGFRY